MRSHAEPFACYRYRKPSSVSQPGLCLAIRVGRRCKAKDVVAVLEELTSVYPAPMFIRSDNGPVFNAQALRDWCRASDTTSKAYIELGSPGKTAL